MIDLAHFQISPELLFHARPGLEARLQLENEKKTPDAGLTSAIGSALEYIAEKFGWLQANLESLLAKGEITHDLLWVLFPPGTTVVSQENYLKVLQASKVTGGEYGESQEQGRFYKVESDEIHHTGTRFGWMEVVHKISSFEGSKKIINLSFYPLKFHPDAESIRSNLIERGRKYVEITQTPTYQEYSDVGICEEVTMGQATEKPFTTTGRIMVDPTAFASQNPHAELLIPRYDYREDNVTPSAITEDELLVCEHRVLGFAFDQKKWGVFAVSKTRPISWNESAFDKLIMEEKKRKMVSLLVRSHRNDNDVFDDIVRGKGKGLVGLLSGSPGVGKTLTAEVVAELSRRPLYVVSAGELGTTADTADDQLGVILDITKRWNCVLLIDEADVFLYRRAEGQLDRNALVSVFLRRLEYEPFLQT